VISIAGNVDVKMYYEEFPLEADHSLVKLKEWMEKVMEQVRKNHYSAFCKHLLMCNLAFGIDFQMDIQVHYDMKFELKMLTKKL
jgi:hypothetical protein